MRLEDISKKPLTVALEEIADGRIEYDRPEPGDNVDDAEEDAEE